MKKNFSYYLVLTIKGMAMGAADAVPGISGGTIALLLGIYEELINTIGRINISLLKDLKSNGFIYFWRKLNGNFLLSLIIGIGISLITFIQIAAYFFDKYIRFSISDAGDSKVPFSFNIDNCDSFLY